MLWQIIESPSSKSRKHSVKQNKQEQQNKIQLQYDKEQSGYKQRIVTGFMTEDKALMLYDLFAYPARCPLCLFLLSFRYSLSTHKRDQRVYQEGTHCSAASRLGSF